MARTGATARTAASARGAASARTTVGAYRVPIDLINLGVTHYWDFRTAKLGTNSASVVDPIGMLPMQYRGGTAISTVYVNGGYMADLERGSNDYFASSPIALSSGMTACTWFGWLKLESLGTVRHIITQWETSGNQRGFELRIQSNDTMELGLSVNGTSQTFYGSSTTLVDTTAWHFITATYDTTNRGQFTLDGAAQSTSLTSGSHPPTINSSQVATTIGCNIPSAPANFFDGLIGIVGFAENKSMSSTEITQLYNLTNKLGSYV